MPTPGPARSPGPDHRDRTFSVSLVLPAYDEAETIRQAIREADEALAAISTDYEILVIDDGSRDETAELARCEARGRERVRVLSLPQNRGYGAALRAGFAAASKDLVGFTDADCQFDIREIETLVLLCRRHDAACGYRLDRQDSWLRRLLAKGYNLLVGALFGVGVRDCDCAMKLFRRSTLSSIAPETDGFFIDTELLARLRRAGASIVEVGVTHRPRLAGTSTVSLRHVPEVLAEVVRFWWAWTLFPGANSKPLPRVNTRSVVASWLALLAAASLLLLTGLSHPLQRPDELRYARISAETSASGDFVVPTLEGRPYLDKPPLLYWLVSASYRALGESEWAARLPGALAALLTALATLGLGRPLVGLRGGLLGALLLVTTIGLTGAGHYLSTDAILVACTTIGLLALFKAIGTSRFRPIFAVTAGVACALGFLAKGPIAFILVLPPVALSRWLGRSPVKLTAPRWLLFVVPAVAIPLPWLVLISKRQPDFFEYFFWRHNLVRFASPFDHQFGWWFYLPVILGLMFPVSLLLPVLFRFLSSRAEALRRLRTGELGFLVLASIWPIVFFSMSGSKLPSYVLPAAPPLCLLLGALLDAALKRESDDPALEWLALGLPRILTLGGLAMFALLALVDIRFDGTGSVSGHKPVWVMVAVALAAATALAGLKPPLGRGWWAAAAMAWWLTLGFLFLDLYPEVAKLRAMPRTAASMVERLGAPRPVILAIGSRQGPGVFYMRRDGIDDLAAGDWDRLRQYADIYPRLLLLMDPEYKLETESALAGWQIAGSGAGDHLFLATSPQLVSASLPGSRVSR